MFWSIYTDISSNLNLKAISNKYLDSQKHICPTYDISSHFSIFNTSSKDFLLYLTSLSDYTIISVSGTFLSVLVSQGKRITVIFWLISVAWSPCRSNIFQENRGFEFSLSLLDIQYFCYSQHNTYGQKQVIVLFLKGTIK